jgi:hypothetical protein
MIYNRSLLYTQTRHVNFRYNSLIFAEIKGLYLGPLPFYIGLSR